MTVERGFCTTKAQAEHLLEYGLTEKAVWFADRSAETLDRCLATFRGRPGILVVAHVPTRRRAGSCSMSSTSTRARLSTTKSAPWIASRLHYVVSLQPLPAKFLTSNNGAVMTDTDLDDDEDGPVWFSPFAWPRWARIAFAVTLPISGPLWIVAFMVGGVLTMVRWSRPFALPVPSVSQSNFSGNREPQG